MERVQQHCPPIPPPPAAPCSCAAGRCSAPLAIGTELPVQLLIRSCVLYQTGLAHLRLLCRFREKLQQHDLALAIDGREGHGALASVGQSKRPDDHGDEPVDTWAGLPPADRASFGWRLRISRPLQPIADAAAPTPPGTAPWPHRGYLPPLDGPVRPDSRLPGDPGSAKLTPTRSSYHSGFTPAWRASAAHFEISAAT